MKRKHDSIWLLTAILAVFLTVVMNWQGQEIVPELNHSERTESSLMSPQRQLHHEATLTDANGLYRICSMRPQRIVPSQGARSKQSQTSYGYRVRQHLVKPLHSYFDSRCRMESAPFCLSSSCDYYVIALRHIIR